MTGKLMPSVYAGNAAYYAELMECDELVIESKENFIKQTYRNRCEILSANGKLKLIIPLRKRHNHTPMDKILISDEEAWQALHWKSITAAYRSSPFFEFYEEHFEPFYLENQYTVLMEFNSAFQKRIFEILQINLKESYTSAYHTDPSPYRDFRSEFSPKSPSSISFPSYQQVFSDKLGFTANLSILDLLFNLGPQTSTYLKSIHTN